MNESNWIIFAGIAAVAVVAMLAAWRHQQARREALGALAMELGWMFHPDGIGGGENDLLTSLLGRLSGSGTGAHYGLFEVFNRGRDRRAYNTLQGTLLLPASGENRRQCAAVAGDYRYTTGSGKNKRTCRFSYLLVELPAGPVPETMIRPEGVFDQLAGFIGFDDIDFESAAFSDAFHVKSTDKRFAYDLCDARMMEFLLATRPMAFELERFHLCITDGRSRWSPDDFKGRMVWLGNFLDRWPRHLVDRIAPRRASVATAGSNWGAGA
jgi:hypothetical protein